MKIGKKEAKRLEERRKNVPKSAYPGAYRVPGSLRK